MCIGMVSDPLGVQIHRIRNTFELSWRETLPYDSLLDTRTCGVQIYLYRKL